MKLVSKVLGSIRLNRYRRILFERRLSEDIPLWTSISSCVATTCCLPSAVILGDLGATFPPFFLKEGEQDTKSGTTKLAHHLEGSFLIKNNTSSASSSQIAT